MEYPDIHIMNGIADILSETHITAEELIRREYGDCAFFDDKTFISDGKLYRYFSQCGCYI